jgi:DNA repair protein RadC
MSMKKMRDLPSHDRPREKLASRGAEALTDVELVALLLGRGVKGRDVSQIAGEVARYLKDNGGSPSYKELLAIEGVGAAKACEIMASFELGRRYLADDDGVAGSRITRPDDVLPLVSEWRDRKQEYFLCITLNGAGEVIERRVVTVGILNQSLVHPREVFAEAITDRAASVILVHNHPSGTLEPSSQDIGITRQLVEAGSILGIRVLDHIIITKKSHVSLRELGHL